MYKPVSQDPTPGSSSSGEAAKDEKKPFKRKGGASPQAPGPKKPKSREKSCYSFSYGGKCVKEKCEFLHVCYRCGDRSTAQLVHYHFTLFSPSNDLIYHLPPSTREM